MIAVKAIAVHALAVNLIAFREVAIFFALALGPHPQLFALERTSRSNAKGAKDAKKR